ncbi:MAG: DNA replication/repair protein RecF [Acutalibacteraceae bacterium]|nr:DNA replication/repair protein RecF [Acutalibacteraceae bacterium]
MKAKKLTGANFRNLLPFSVEFCDGMNIIYGDNAQGKTNLIEALWLFTGAKSFRTSKDAELVAFGSSKSEINLDFVSGGIEREAKITVTNRRLAELDTKKLKSPSLLAGNFCATVFSPSDLLVVKDGPALRRRFLDLAIGQLYPSYVALLKSYTRAVTQRNTLLKSMDGRLVNNEMLDVFEQEIVNSGQKIIDYRIKYCKQVTANAADIYAELSSLREELSAEYIPSCELEDMAERLYISRKNDIFSCTTSVGPHRDDLDFKINGISARNFGSQGQQRSVALSLKLAESKTLKDITGEQPVAILDDVMSELDPDRQAFILNHIKDWQVFITCCDHANIKPLKEGKIFTVRGGKIKG